MPAILMHEVEKRLQTFGEIGSSNVSLDDTTLWTEDLMSVEYRSKLVNVGHRKLPACAHELARVGTT